MTHKEAVDDLNTIKEFFEQESGAYPVSLEYAIKVLKNELSTGRPSEVIYGNEHNCIMTMFGECSYAETGCGDCAVVEKVRKALSAGIAQGEWIDRSDGGRILHPWWESYECSQCKEQGSGAWSFCPHCGAKMKGKDDEDNH